MNNGRRHARADDRAHDNRVEAASRSLKDSSRSSARRSSTHRRTSNLECDGRRSKRTHRRRGPERQHARAAGRATSGRRGKTIVPGLWDNHAHLHQIEWIPTYFAAGVTSVRDMGSEWPLLVAMRNAIRSGKISGPNLFFAGLVDGLGHRALVNSAPRRRKKGARSCAAITRWASR